MLLIFSALAIAWRCRLGLLLVGLVLAGWPAAAQDTLATRRPTAPPVAPALITVSVDTAAALHQLFSSQRRNGAILTGFGAAGLVAGAFTVGASSGAFTSEYLIGTSGLIAGAAGVIWGASLLVEYSESREQRMLRAWQAHRLPPNVLRQAIRFQFERAYPPL